LNEDTGNLKAVKGLGEWVYIVENMAIPTVIQDMFAIVKRQYTDTKHREYMYNVVRLMICFRDRNVPNSCRLDVLFAQRDKLKSQLELVLQCPAYSLADSIDEVFRLGGYISPPQPAFNTPLVPRHAPVHPEPCDRTVQSRSVVDVPSRHLRSLEIDAEGFETVVIHFGNGKKVVLHV
jgi:hypothetical protein